MKCWSKVEIKPGQVHDKNADVFSDPPHNDILVRTGCPKVPQNDRTHMFLSFFPTLVQEVVLNRSGKSWLFHDFGGPFSAISSGIDFSSTFDEIGIQKPTLCVTFFTILHILSIIALRVDLFIAFLFVVRKILNNSLTGQFRIREEENY